MSAVVKKVIDAAGREYRRFQCPGCNESHVVSVKAKGTWGFNGNEDRPTFTPSVLITSGHYLSTHKPGDRCWCVYNAERPNDPAPFRCRRCHSFVTDGQIQFLGDCTHALAGKTVPLSPIIGSAMNDEDPEKL